jgi:membrane dipeptidase
MHVAWHLQYVGETTQLDPADYTDMSGRLGQVAGYLQSTAAAFVSCRRSPADLARHADPWAALAQMLARVEAEFPGRILASPADHARWRDDRDGLTWAVLHVGGLEALVRGPDDLDRLPALFDRGARVFRPIQGPGGALGDDGLTSLRSDLLAKLIELGAEGGPRPLVDLAGMSARTRGDVLDWFEAAPERARRLVPIVSHGGLDEAAPGALGEEHLRRLRALGGHLGLSVGPPHVASGEALRASIERVASVPFMGEPGFQGIGVGTDFLGLSSSLPGLEDAGAVVAWLMANFEGPVARGLIAGQATRLVEVATGVAEGR